MIVGAEEDGICAGLGTAIPTAPRASSMVFWVFFETSDDIGRT